jgi:O-antigen ligase
MKLVSLLRLRIFQALFFIAPITTLAISPWQNLDPISLIKVSVISTGAFLIIGMSVPFIALLFSKMDSSVRFLSILFIISLVSTLLFSGAPLQQQLWGMFGRTTGFVTYLSLLILMLFASVLQDRFLYQRLLSSLVITCIPMNIYCYVQIAGKDPIMWSEYQTFGTLGNINFLSAFLGIASIAAVASAFNLNNSKAQRFFGLSICTSSMYIVSTTDSIQGILIFIVGVSTLIGIWLYSFSSKKLFWSFISLNIGALYLVVLGLQDKGLLRSFLFQPSVVFRGDYWHAGFEMTLEKPFFGVGLDSYGDWYREVRGEISTLRTGPDRITNTAHNIFLDISSNGGFPLLLAYLGFVALILVRALFAIRKLREPDPVLSTAFAVWLAYQVQALISINQVGVGVWGWIISGVLLGLTSSQMEQDAQDSQPLSKKLAKQLRGKPLPATSAVFGAVGFLLGLALNFAPLKADADFRSASFSGDSQKVISALDSLGITAYHYGVAIQKLVSSGSIPEAKSLCASAHEKFPRDYYAVRICYLLNTDNDLERDRWLRILRTMDPYNPEYQ